MTTDARPDEVKFRPSLLYDPEAGSLPVQEFYMARPHMETTFDYPTIAPDLPYEDMDEFTKKTNYFKFNIDGNQTNTRKIRSDSGPVTSQFDTDKRKYTQPSYTYFDTKKDTEVGRISPSIHKESNTQMKGYETPNVTFNHRFNNSKYEQSETEKQTDPESAQINGKNHIIGKNERTGKKSHSGTREYIANVWQQMREQYSSLGGDNPFLRDVPDPSYLIKMFGSDRIYSQNRYYSRQQTSSWRRTKGYYNDRQRNGGQTR